MFDNDNYDIDITLYDIDSNADPKEARIQLKRITRLVKSSENADDEEEQEDEENNKESKDSEQDDSEDQTTDQEENTTTVDDEEIETEDTEVESEVVATQMGDSIIILESERPKPFKIDTIFTRYCLFIYYIDDQPRVQKYFHKGETHPISAVSQAELRFSDGGAVNLRVAGFDINLDNIGQVSGRKIKWMENQENGKYQLIVTPIR